MVYAQGVHRRERRLCALWSAQGTCGGFVVDKRLSRKRSSFGLPDWESVSILVPAQGGCAQGVPVDPDEFWFVKLSFGSWVLIPRSCSEDGLAWSDRFQLGRSCGFAKGCDESKKATASPEDKRQRRWTLLGGNRRRVVSSPTCSVPVHFQSLQWTCVVELWR